MSASRSSFSGDIVAFSVTAIPTLALTESWSPSTSKGPWNASHHPSGDLADVVEADRSSSTITNSSPPKRATVSRLAGSAQAHGRRAQEAVADVVAAPSLMSLK